MPRLEDNLLLARLATALGEVPGIVAVALGGSRARGAATAGSDYDLGLYFRAAREPTAEQVRQAVRGIADHADSAVITEVGAWGPWIVGGAWLQVRGVKVDLLYRCVEWVAEIIGACRRGEVTMAYQPGHPHGFSSAIWMGEVAYCRPLHDPDGVLAGLRAMAEPYPEALRTELIKRFRFEVGFAIENGATALGRRDATHVAGSAYRALCSLAQVLFAANRRYLLNEKGALLEAAGLAVTIPDLAHRTASVWAAIGHGALEEALDRLRAMDGDLDAALAAAG